MHLDGRWEPLTSIAQAAALTAVLWGWWRHDRKHPTPAARAQFYTPQEVTGPRSNWR